MSKRRTGQADSAMARAKRSSNDHKLVGRDVVFRGRVWRVTGARKSPSSHGSPWLTLRRGFGIEAMAKPYELTEARN